MSEYHKPVMLRECLEGLGIRPDGVYVDVTFGGGGHSRAILDQLGEAGKLYAFDQDEEAAREAEKIQDNRFFFVPANFRYIRRYLKINGIQKVDGLLADLGVSSHQIDTPERGFSTRFSGPLDMRMNQQAEKTAYAIIHTYKESELHKILGIYGEIRNAKTLANVLVRARLNQEIQDIDQLKSILKPYAPPGKSSKYFAQVFQALRIEVNEELKALEEMLLASPDILLPAGRLVVLSYHSLEDRLVKNFIQKGKFQGEVEKDFYGNPQGLSFKAIHRKPIVAGAAEVMSNNRARSAKLRVAERLDDLKS